MAVDCGSSCPVAAGFYTYDPSIAGNAVLLAAFGVLIPIAVFLGLRFRTALFSAALTTGLLLEVIGFVGRILLHAARDKQEYFIVFLVGNVLGPAFITASIFLVLPHILTVYGEHLSPLRPALAAAAFYSLIVAAVVVQIVGIVLLVRGSDGTSRRQGADITAGGLGVQAVALLLFTGFHLWFTLGLSTTRSRPDPRHSTVYRSLRFKRFLMGIETASGLLLVSSVYRAVEMAGGIGGTLFQNQVAFMIMDGAVPLLSAILLTIFHPGAAFGSAWGATAPRTSKRRAPPPPLQPSRGYEVHHRYDPELRSQISPASQRSTPREPGLSGGSPGLPANPRPTNKRTSPLLASPMSKTSRESSNKTVSLTMPSPASRASRTSSKQTSPGMPSISAAVDEEVLLEDRPERKSGAPAKDLVDREALW